ncbi:zinc-binding alcohol dehydrogenase family protein [Leucothrix pacifica]|uniref:Zinc-type alcohol dehydrogenase-like protein n=2 Tax=Leucothrix pacifica TaxID=1247513 RepID=A0A317CBN7_9GAMM|nr:zinc-binding alcohol dehydrogenase family protein [Leucothrix pacifica]
MKAVGYTQAGAIDAPDALIDFEAAVPEIGARDLLVEVRAISVNPVDTKIRSNVGPEAGTKIIGYDAAGVVTQVGSEVTQYSIGDEVYYAGDLTRAGTNSEFHAVDERIVGKKPASLSFADAAGMPLTSITAWELLFDSLAVKEDNGENDSILIIGGAGGVGSILIQLAKKLTKLTVIATASRDDTIEWVNKMGADHVINHHEPLAEQVKALGLTPRYVASLTASDQHFESVIDLIKPRGHIAMIDDPEVLDTKLGKRKALSFSWEFMFTRSMFETEDIEEQRVLLNRVSEMLDTGELISTVTQNLGTINAENLKTAHIQQESGRAIGKTVLEGF